MGMLHNAVKMALNPDRETDLLPDDADLTLLYPNVGFSAILG
ncbi:hypothetical protein [Edaphovirga cremea]|nr:hypothetical protein [Edaphovirga cremea]